MVRLSEEARGVCQEISKKRKGSSQQFRRAQSLLEAEAKGIALRLGKPPAGDGHWSWQLLADEMVALESVDSSSHETVRKVLKKPA